MAASAEPTKNAMRERALDVDAERRGHLPVVDPGPDDHPGPRAVEPCPEDDSDDDAEREDRQAGQRVLDPGDLKIDPAFRPARPRDGGEVSAAGLKSARTREMRDDLVGDDHRERDGDQRLAEILSLVPPEECLLNDESEPADASIATAMGINHSQVVTSVPGMNPGVSAVILCCTS